MSALCHKRTWWACRTLSVKTLNVGARHGGIPSRGGKDADHVDFVRHFADSLLYPYPLSFLTKIPFFMIFPPPPPPSTINRQLAVASNPQAEVRPSWGRFNVDRAQ